MRRFRCPSCDEPLWFDNDRCERCGTEVAFDPVADRFVTDTAVCDARRWDDRCNWVRDTASADAVWCRSCALDLDHVADPLRRPFQAAKRRTVRQLLRLGVDPRGRTPELRFALPRGTEEHPVTIGHADGVITLDVAEAEPARREALRVALGEPYRTPLGHVRHELGHWWWQHANGTSLDTQHFRDRFGDERADYAEALERHYDAPDDGAWREAFVSHYAASHPWEDFAESFAHVLHLLDTLETAADHGIVDLSVDDVTTASFERLYPVWVELTSTLNDLNRAMGTADPYPFVAPAPAVEKFEFVHESLREGASGVG